jgi:hypothetical protein
MQHVLDLIRLDGERVATSTARGALSGGHGSGHVGSGSGPSTGGSHSLRRDVASPVDASDAVSVSTSASDMLL